MTITEIREKTKGRTPGIMDVKKRAAVIIPLIETENGIDILFETRTGTVSDPGEVCFPGGRIENGETPLQAAVRECCEELGITEDAIEPVCACDVLTAYGGRVIYPFAARLRTTDFHPGETEVAELFTIPLSFLEQTPPEDHSLPLTIVEPEGFDASVFGVSGSYRWKKALYELPVWKYEGRFLWGLSARIMRDFLRILSEK